jgi:hypothetical protein
MGVCSDRGKMVIAAAFLLFQPVCAPAVSPKASPFAIHLAAIAQMSGADITSGASQSVVADGDPAKPPAANANSQLETGSVSYLPGMLDPKAAPAADSASVAPGDPAPQPILVIPAKPASPARVSTKKWWALSAAMHGAATFDAYSTRRFMLNGTGYELNPILRPIAGSPGIYAAIQVLPVALDFVSRKMMHSASPTLRRFWWMPQSVAATSSFICAAHNMTLR